MGEEEAAMWGNVANGALGGVIVAGLINIYVSYYFYTVAQKYVKLGREDEQ